MTGETQERGQRQPAGEEADAITRDTLVGEALGRVGIEPCIVGEQDDLMQVTEAMAAKPGTQTAAVVDKERRLVGAIPMRLLLAELYLRVAPEEFLVGMRAMEDIEEFGKISRARTAKELMQPPVWVTMGDSARDAFAKMHEHKLEGLPIVDRDMRVVGYLDRFQLVRLWLQKHREKRSSPADAEAGV